MSLFNDIPGQKQSECRGLLDACTPFVYIDNAFRITGLLVDATTREVKRRIDDLKAAEAMGDAKEEHRHAYALKPPPPVDAIRQAARRLQDPESRIIDEFFWFWPSEWGKGKSDPALCALSKADTDTAFKIWSQSVSSNHATASAVAKHNLAVMYHLVALDSEQVALKSALSPEQLATIEKHWRTCFRHWEELSQEEVFWGLVTNRIRKLDDPRLTTGFARRMRATFPEAMDKINAMLAVKYIEVGSLDLAKRHVTYMHETNQGLDDIPRTLAIVTGPLVTRVRAFIGQAETAAGRLPAQAAETAFELLSAVSQPLHIMQTILPADNHDFTDASDAVVQTCLHCQIAYAREISDWQTCLRLIAAAEKYAVSPDVKCRLAENRSIVNRNRVYAQYVDPLVKRIAEIRARPAATDKASAIDSDVRAHLSIVERAEGTSAEAYELCADAAARHIRNLAVATYNERGNARTAIQLVDTALRIVRDRETRELLQKDRKELEAIDAEAKKHNLLMHIRSDEIEVTDERVRYNARSMPVSSVRGVKFGIFAHYTNGVKDRTSYLIDVTDGLREYIHIECKRIFRSEAKAIEDFNRIIDALFHQVVPSLVQRTAEEIIAGSPRSIWTCGLTRDGMAIKTGSLWWAKETLVPYSELRFFLQGGQLHALSHKDERISTSMSLRDTWNAVIFEFIAKAVVRLKAEAAGQS